MEANAETDDKSDTKAIIVSDLKIEFNVLEVLIIDRRILQ